MFLFLLFFHNIQPLSCSIIVWYDQSNCHKLSKEHMQGCHEMPVISMQVRQHTVSVISYMENRFLRDYRLQRFMVNKNEKHVLIQEDANVRYTYIRTLSDFSKKRRYIHSVHFMSFFTSLFQTCIFSSLCVLHFLKISETGYYFLKMVLTPRKIRKCRVLQNRP